MQHSAKKMFGTYCIQVLLRLVQLRHYVHFVFLFRCRRIDKPNREWTHQTTEPAGKSLGFIVLASKHLFHIIQKVLCLLTLQIENYTGNL